MKIITMPQSNDALLDLQNRLCAAFDAENMPLVLELSREIDAYQLALWSKESSCLA